MVIPEGYTEDQLIKIILSICKQLATHFKFGYYDVDDLIQEGFIFAMESLPRYNPQNKERCSLETFLKIHIRNRFINLQRDKYFRQKTPCVRCKHRLDDDDCKIVVDKAFCPKWVAWLDRNVKKKDLADAYEHKNTECEVYDYDGKIDAEEIFNYVSHRIPLDMRDDYLKFIEGCKLSDVKREMLMDKVKSILKDSPYVGLVDEEEQA